MDEKQKVRAAIRKAYARDYGKFKNAFDHDFSNYQAELSKEFKEPTKAEAKENRRQVEDTKKSFKKNVRMFEERSARERQARLKKAGSLFRAVSKGVGVLGVAGAVNEVRKAHKEIKKAGPGNFGSKTLLEILK